MYEISHFKEKRKEIPPFGPLYLAATAEEYGAQVAILKVTVGNTRLDLRRFNIVAFSILASISYGLMKKVRFDSLYSDHTLILVGGVHPSIFPEKTLIDFEADIVAFGQGEITFREIINKSPNVDKNSVRGICFKKDKQIVRTAPRELLNSLDQLPIPARHLLEETDFIMDNRLASTHLRMIYIMASRGCSSACRFCAVNQHRVQYRSGVSIRSELKHLVGRFGIEGFAIVDDNFTAKEKSVVDVCEAISTMKLNWSALCRVNSVNYELLTIMRNAGCIEIKLGVESGSNALLKAMGKQITTDMIKLSITAAAQTGMEVKIFLLHGFPGENMETTKETIELIKPLRNSITRVSLSRFVPLPGSYVFKHPEKFDLHIAREMSGDYERCYMYKNHHHWWGTEKDFEEVNCSYDELVAFLKRESLFET